MNLKKISIENFKCFGNQVDIDFGRLTLLTGANSSGKSSIIYSILGAIQSGEFPFQFSTNGKYVNMGDYEEIVHNHKWKEKIKLDFTFDGGLINEIKSTWVENKTTGLPELFDLDIKATYFALKVERAKDNKRTVTYNFFTGLYPSDGRHAAFFQKTNSNTILAELTLNDFPNLDEEEYNDLKGDVIYLQAIIEDIANLVVDYNNEINFISPFRLPSERANYEHSNAKLKVGKHGEGYLDQIIYWETKKDPKLKELIEIIQNLNLLHSFKAKRIGGGMYEILVKAKKNGIETSLSDVGSGVSQFLPIMVADLQLPDDSTLYVAEPESHLHPSVQSSVGDYFVNQIAATSKNYVVETHSEYLLNKIRLAIVKGEIKEEEVKVLFIDNDGDENVIHNIRFNTKGQIINAPQNFFKTYMMDVMEIAINAAE